MEQIVGWSCDMCENFKNKGVVSDRKQFCPACSCAIVSQANQINVFIMFLGIMIDS